MALSWTGFLLVTQNGFTSHFLPTGILLVRTILFIHQFRLLFLELFSIRGRSNGDFS